MTFADTGIIKIEMPTASHITSLIKSHFEKDDLRFTTICLQIAAHEAKIGHKTLADDIQKIVDRSNQTCPETY